MATEIRRLYELDRVVRQCSWVKVVDASSLRLVRVRVRVWNRWVDFDLDMVTMTATVPWDCWFWHPNIECVVCLDAPSGVKTWLLQLHQLIVYPRFEDPFWIGNKCRSPELYYRQWKTVGPTVLPTDTTLVQTLAYDLWSWGCHGNASTHWEWARRRIQSTVRVTWHAHPVSHNTPKDIPFTEPWVRHIHTWASPNKIVYTDLAIWAMNQWFEFTVWCCNGEWCASVDQEVGWRHPNMDPIVCLCNTIETPRAFVMALHQLILYPNFDNMAVRMTPAEYYGQWGGPIRCGILTHARVRAKAERYWIQRPDRSPTDHWFRAELVLARDMARRHHESYWEVLDRWDALVRCATVTTLPLDWERSPCPPHPLSIGWPGLYWLNRVCADATTDLTLDECRRAYRMDMDMRRPRHEELLQTIAARRKELKESICADKKAQRKEWSETTLRCQATLHDVISADDCWWTQPCGLGRALIWHVFHDRGAGRDGSVAPVDTGCGAPGS